MANTVYSRPNTDSSRSNMAYSRANTGSSRPNTVCFGQTWFILGQTRYPPESTQVPPEQTRSIPQQTRFVLGQIPPARWLLRPVFSCPPFDLRLRLIIFRLRPVVPHQPPPVPRQPVSACRGGAWRPDALGFEPRVQSEGASSRRGLVPQTWARHMPHSTGILPMSRSRRSKQSAQPPGLERPAPRVHARPSAWLKRKRLKSKPVPF